MSERIPLVDLRAQYAAIREEIDAAMRRVVESSAFMLGAEVERFERDFAAYCGAAGAVGVASGTAALQLALRALDIGPGDEVVTAAHTFVATAEAIVHVGATPVFADIDEATYCLDPAAVEAVLAPRTKAILAVHLYGHPADTERLGALAERKGLALVEDAAQAHGAEISGRRCGSLGRVACFSFYPGKNLGAYGDAGAVVSDDRDVLERVALLRNHARTTKYEHAEVGFCERLDGLQAAVLGAKLPHLESWTERRRAHARTYARLLSGAPVVLPVERPGCRHVYHLFVIRTPRRDAVLEHLQKSGIEAGIHYPLPLHRQPAFLSRGYGAVTLPVSERVAREIVSLPLYPELTEEQIARVVRTVREVTG